MALPLRKKKKKAWEKNCRLKRGRQPFCTTSRGTDRHREALALSWHRPDSRHGVVSDSQTGACQAWHLSLVTSVHTISAPSSVARLKTLTLGSLSALLFCPEHSLPPGFTQRSDLALLLDKMGLSLVNRYLDTVECICGFFLWCISLK